jgi:hypothetical protein
MWGKRAIAVSTKRWVYGHKLICAGRAEYEAASSASTTMWWEDEVKKML